MKKLALILSALLAISPALAGPPTGSAAGNLAGYAQNAAGLYSSVQATWRVPTANFGNQITYSVSGQWVGVNGMAGDIGGVIQCGTIQEMQNNGSTAYYGWWGNAAGGVNPISTTTYPVRPGDVIMASEVCTANCGSVSTASTWLCTIQSVTRGWTFTNSLSLTSHMADADVIQEAITDPSNCSAGNCPLPNYGTVPFTSVLVNGAAPNLQTSQERYTQMSTSQSSNPSDPNATADGFNVCWGNAAFTYTPCSTTVTLATASGSSAFGGF